MTICVAVAKTGGVLHVTCSAPPGLHTVYVGQSGQHSILATSWPQHEAAEAEEDSNNSDEDGANLEIAREENGGNSASELI